MKRLVLLLAFAGIATAVPTIDEILGDRPDLDERPMSAACRARYEGATAAESTHSYNVRHYRLDLSLPMTDRSYTAHEALSIMSEVPMLDSLSLDFCNLVCDSVKRAGVPLQFTTPTNLLAIMLDTPMPQGDSTVIDIFYHRLTTAPELGYYFATRPTISYAYGMTCTPPRDARYWMPCYDEPLDKAERGVMLDLTVPDTFQTCANGMLDSVTSDPGNGTKTYWWRHPYGIATYLIVFAASRFSTWRHHLPRPGGETIPSIYFMWPYDSTISLTTFSHIPDMMAYYSDTARFGPYPFEKYGMVPGYYGFPWGGMENQTMTMIHTQWLRSGDDAGMAHELSHMWYGDMVTCVDFRNVWLNEGFATYCECMYMGHASGRSYFQNYIRGKASAAISQDRSRRFPIFNPPEEEIYNYGTIYCKGAWVEHMLRFVEGDTAWEQPGVFFRGLRTYGDSFRYGTASTDDYCRINEQVTGMELSWFFDEWVYQAGYPKYHLTWQPEQLGDTWRLITILSQTNGNLAPPVFHMPLPVKVHCAGSDTMITIRPDASPQTDTFLVAACPESLTVDPDNWVLDSAYVTQTGVEEGDTPYASRPTPDASIVRGVLFLDAGHNPIPFGELGLCPKPVLLDISGRKVLALVPGPNDVSDLAPGVYFVRTEPSAVRKVVVAH